MSLSVIPSALPFPGVQPGHFRRNSELHGVGHVNRVICLGQMLGLEVERDLREAGWFARWSAPLWAAAFLHDLARRHDNNCLEHGRWAVDERMPALRRRFIDNGVREEDLPAVATAVEYHSLRVDVPREHPHWVLTALLKDADALDRCRLGPDEQVRLEFLRFPVSRTLIPAAEALYVATVEDPALVNDLPALWQSLRAACC